MEKHQGRLYIYPRGQLKGSILQYFAALSCCLDCLAQVPCLSDPSATQYFVVKTQARGTMMGTLHCTVHAGLNRWLLAYVTVNTLSKTVPVQMILGPFQDTSYN